MSQILANQIILLKIENSLVLIGSHLRKHAGFKIPTK